MLAWRICRRPFADFTGDGARLHGGRWNSPGRPVVYGAADAALAVLDVRVHLDLSSDLLPDDYVLVAMDLGEAMAENLAALPSDPAAHGDAWLAERRSLLLKVPSVIAPESLNLLINPRPSGRRTVRIASVRPFAFDGRLWNPAAR